MSVLAAVLSLLFLTAGEDAGSAEVLSVPASIDATGDRDVTGQLNAFLASVEDGTTVTFEQGGRYRAEGSVVLEGHRDVTLDGNGAVLFADSEGGSSRSHLVLEGVQGVVVRDLVIRGAHPRAGTGEDAWRVDRAFQHGIRINGSTEVEIDGVRVTDVFGDLVYVGPGQRDVWSERVWIHDSTLARNGRQGIAVTAARDVVIERNDISQTRRATIDLEPGAPQHGVENVHILDNEVGPGRMWFVLAHGSGPVDRVVIARNVLRGRHLQIDVEAHDGVDRRHGFWVLDHRGDEVASMSSIRFRRVDGVVVRGNTQEHDDAALAGIEADDVCGMDVGDNRFGSQVLPLLQTRSRCGTPPSEPPERPAFAHGAAAEPVGEVGTTDPTAGGPGGSSGGAPTVPLPAVLVVGLAAAGTAGTLTWVLVRNRRESRDDGAGEEPLTPRPYIGFRSRRGPAVDTPSHGARTIVDVDAEVRPTGGPAHRSTPEDRPSQPALGSRRSEPPGGADAQGGPGMGRSS